MATVENRLCPRIGALPQESAKGDVHKDGFGSLSYHELGRRGQTFEPYNDIDEVAVTFREVWERAQQFAQQHVAQRQQGQ